MADPARRLRRRSRSIGVYIAARFGRAASGSICAPGSAVGPAAEAKQAVLCPADEGAARATVARTARWHLQVGGAAMPEPTAAPLLGATGWIGLL